MSGQGSTESKTHLTDVNATSIHPLLLHTGSQPTQRHLTYLFNNIIRQDQLYSVGEDCGEHQPPEDILEQIILESRVAELLTAIRKIEEDDYVIIKGI